MNQPVRLGFTPHEKIWGSPETEPWFPNSKRQNIGEIWFTQSDSVPILVKLLFTSDKLSVQVHPGDAYAEQHHNCKGKTEMWHILRAEPGSQVALGLRQTVSKERLKAAALSGEIVDLLNWVPARPGDTFFVPAGTIHAIGGGLALCEVQQFSDKTYRMYDYGRDRELHLEDGIAVSDCGPHDGIVKPRYQVSGRDLLVECDYFRTERMAVQGRWRSEPAPVKTLYIALDGEGFIAGQPFRAGECWEVDPGSDPFEIESTAAVFLLTAEPAIAPSR